VLIIGQALIEFFSKDQGKKAAKHMACNISIILMIDGSGFQKRFDIPEHALDSPQFLVLESNLIGSQFRVRGKHPLAVKTLFALDLSRIYPGTVFGQFKILAKAFIANQRFGAFFQLPLQRFDDRFPIGSILACLAFIQANDIAGTVMNHFFDL
jgi:hypothetical protein